MAINFSGITTFFYQQDYILICHEKDLIHSTLDGKWSFVWVPDTYLSHKQATSVPEESSEPMVFLKCSSIVRSALQAVCRHARIHFPLC
jgi:hypothetical protein